MTVEIIQTALVAFVMADSHWNSKAMSDPVWLSTDNGSV